VDGQDSAGSHFRCTFLWFFFRTISVRLRKEASTHLAARAQLREGAVHGHRELAHLGSGRIVASKIEAPNTLANLV
jgi:hypothetical protein